MKTITYKQENYIRNLLTYKIIAKNHPGYTFSHEDGSPYSDIKSPFKGALKRAGIENFRFHDLRHTLASKLVMAGVDIRVVQELMGHKSITMTMKYSHL